MEKKLFNWIHWKKITLIDIICKGFLRNYLHEFEYFSVNCYNLFHKLKYSFIVQYLNIFHFADPRVSDWPLMSNPFGIILISLAYLSFVLYLGPLYMKDRKPHALVKTMICYNISVATASAVIFYGVSIINK